MTAGTPLSGQTENLQTEKIVSEPQPAPDANRLRLARAWIRQARGLPVESESEE